MDEYDDGSAVWLWTIAILVMIAVGVLIVAVRQPKLSELSVTPTTQST